MIKLVDYFAVVGYDSYDSNNQHRSTKNNEFTDENDYLNIDDNYFNTSSLSSSNHQNGTSDESVHNTNSILKGRAKIIQRFPKYPTDNQDEFDSNIHCFCQPHRGWNLYKKQEAPTFFVSVLTDIKGQRRYCATLTFLEPYKSSNKSGSSNRISQNSSSNNFNDQDDLDSCCEEFDDLSTDNNNKRNAIIDSNSLITASTKLMDSPIEPCKLYSAKSLVLISRLEYIDLFKSCLSLIYACYVDKRHNMDNKLLETIVANLLTINVNLPGTALTTAFTLGADDKHIVQANASLTVPSTGSCVYKLFKEIGIVNVFKLVCAVAADFKVLFFSRSYIKLYESCKALESLLFPLKYTGVFVPVLPCFGSFLEFPSAPTPYIIGIHSSFRRIIETMHSDSLIECIKVDLDGSHVCIPQCVDDLIMGLDSNQKINNDLNGGGTASSTSSSGISSYASSSNGSSCVHQDASSIILNESSSFGIPHCLYESTLNILYSILKPDVLKSDELVEFLQKTSPKNISSPSSCSSPANIISQHSNTSINTISSNKNQTIDNNQVMFVSQLNLSNQQHHSNDPVYLLTTNINQMSHTEIESIWIDKLLRAVFVRLFAQLFAGYRYCLIIIRINPKPVICFNKSMFLTQHNLADNEFMNRLLDSMSFQNFIEERGPSYRHCDIFDDVYADIQSQLKEELEQQIDLTFRNSFDFQSNSLAMTHLKHIAEKLYKYEYPQTSVLTNQLSSQVKNHRYSSSHKEANNKKEHNPLLNQYLHNSYQYDLLTTPNRSYSKIKLPTPDAFKRIHSETFPLLDSTEIHRLINLTINNYQNNQNGNISYTPPRNHLCRPHLVPYGPPIETVKNMSIINKHLINLNESNYFKTNNLNYHKLIERETITNSNSITNNCTNTPNNCTFNSRKLESIAYCVTNIFENNFKEVKKNLNSAYRALRDPTARLHLCTCLQKYVKKNQVILNNEQFEYLCKLLNESLANDTRLDEHNVAYSILPLTSAFYRKLNNGTLDQCIYTKLQHHDVWSNMSFWEMAFFNDVQRSLRPVYLTNEEFAAEQEKENTTIYSSSSSTASNEITDNQKRPNSLSITKCFTNNMPALNLNLYTRPAEKTALEICGEQMENNSHLTQDQLDCYIQNEQGIIRSHVLHYITQMVNMKIPFDINVKIQAEQNEKRKMDSNNNQNNTFLDISTSNNLNNEATSAASTPRSQSFEDNPNDSTKKSNTITTKAPNGELKSLTAASDDSGYDANKINKISSKLSFRMDDLAESEYLDINLIGEIGDTAYKFIKKFVDRVCIEGCLNDQQRQSLHNNLAQMIHMQIQMLEPVYLESKRLPLRTKPKYEQLKPEYMLPGEHFIEPTPLRCHLVPDGREEVCGISSGGSILLPAEGALFLTNYRLIYRGIPINDSFMNDSIITRSFPVAALIKEKKIGNNLKLAISQQSNDYQDFNSLHDGLQMRSSSFQLIKIYFDEEVSIEKIDRFRNSLLKIRYPQSVLEFFCFSKNNNGTNFSGNYLKINNNFMASSPPISPTSSNNQQNHLDYFNGPTMNINKAKEKHSDAIRHFAKNTLRKAGLMPRNNRKLPVQSSNVNGKGTRTPELTRKSCNNTHNNNNNVQSDDDSLSAIDENFIENISPHGISSKFDTNNVSKLIENSLAYRDYLRQGLVSLTENESSSNYSAYFKLSKSNLNYQLCKTYPALFLIPKDVTDECVRKNAKCHRQNRFPLIVWHHPKKRSLILRGSGFQGGKGLIGMLIKNTSQSNTNNFISTTEQNNTTSIEQDKYINEIIRLTKLNCLFDMNNSVTLSGGIAVTPSTHRRNMFSTKFEKAVKTIKNNGLLTTTTTTTTINTSSNNQHKFRTLASVSNQLDYDTASQTDNLNESFTSSNTNSTNAAKRNHCSTNCAPLYIICEKSQVKSFRSEISKDATRYVFIPIDVHDVKDTKNSFKKLCRACVPSTVSSELQQQYQQNTNSKTSRKKSIAHNEISTNSSTTNKNNGFYKQIHDSKWFDQLQLILTISNMIIDRIEDGSSVMVCLEDGWDLTTQVVSLAELLLDPYYRSIEGFSVLIEREWLSYGHRFSRRSNHTIDDQTGFAPIFLQFLDLVHQCFNQFPNAFEFNEFYLEFLAYHYVSNRFKTFLLDSEFERTQFGILNLNNNFNYKSEKFSTTNLHTYVSYDQARSIPSNTSCIWQYILKVHYNSSKFFNFNYQPNMWSVIRPSCDLFKLKLWRYYTKETLCTGPLYDLDLIKLFNLNNTDGVKNNRDRKPSTNGSNNEESNNSSWYPVSVQTAQDYYEQLDQILPTQYETLLKQIMTKYRLNENIIMTSPTSPSSFSSFSIGRIKPEDTIKETYEYLNKILLNNNQINSGDMNSNNFNDLKLSTTSFQQTMPINWKNVWDYFYHTVENKMIKDYMVLNTASSDQIKGLNEQNSNGLLEFVQPLNVTSTPPFPKIVSNPMNNTNILSSNVNGSNHSHEFELSIFTNDSSCNMCNRPFKSNTHFFGMKCRLCSLICHDECLNNYDDSTFIDCNRINHHHDLNLVKSIANLDTSSYSIQSSSSCSTTPNSNYSQANNTNTNLVNVTNKHYHNDSSKLDKDIGSACIITQEIFGAAGLLSTTSNNQNEVEKTIQQASLFDYNEEDNKMKQAQATSPTTVNSTSERINYNNMINWSNHSNGDHQTYAGYLKKQGALFKQWKERYFVLDSVKHQLRYYDSSSNEAIVKGLIDLSDVESINLGLSYSYVHQNTLANQNAITNNQYLTTTKKALNGLIGNSEGNFNENDNKNCFELKTSKRVYYFCAKSPQEAYTWVNQLKLCCLDS